MSEIQVIQFVLAVLLCIAAIFFLVVYIQELRFRIASDKLMCELTFAVEKLSKEGTMQSAAALRELRIASERVSRLNETQLQMTLRAVKFVFGDKRA